MFRKIVWLGLCLILTLFARAATDTSRLRVSLLTCSPGEPLYATFGHTAIRITDSARGSDIVYNYGTFNFDDNGFYIKFIRGRLLYYLSSEYFEDFKATYQYEGRSITEQLLQLSGAEKQKLQQALETNLLPANRFYPYDFFLDNCTTRARDMLLRYKDSVTAFKSPLPRGATFRDALHRCLDMNHKYWTKLSLDLLLGAPADKAMTGNEMEFLPDNLMQAIDSTNAWKSLVISEMPLYKMPPADNTRPFFTPLITLSLLLLVIVLLGFIKNKVIQVSLQGLDAMLFFLSGLMGIVIILMWASDHSMCHSNYNILWALPTHFIMAFFYNSKKRWVRNYFGLTAVILLLLLVAWFLLPQQLNKALIPFVLLLALRSALRWKRETPD